LASKEGSHNAGSSTTTEACESRNKSEESEIESSKARFVTPFNIEEETTDWCNDNENGNENKETSDSCSSCDEKESQGVPHDGMERNILHVLNSIEVLEKKKER
jgi:hypothetical protein